MNRLPIIALALLLFCCGEKKHSPHHSGAPRAFYYWQTSFSAFQWRDSLFQSLNVDKIYYRFFDVDWDTEAKMAVPVSPLSMEEVYYWHSSAEVIPVVFITNETFKNLSIEGSKNLAHQVHHKTIARLTQMVADSPYMLDDGYWEQNPYQIKSKKFDEHQRYDSAFHARMRTVKEVQFDCDWTASTKDKYFAFLSEVAPLFKDMKVTSTVRLYQYKYPKEAGVPPVQRGMLMCYNAGNAKDLQEKNSIFDKDQVMGYLDGASYPLKLDYALPIFQWALLYQNGKLAAILPASIVEEYKDNFVRDGDDYIVNQDFTFGYTVNSTLLRNGDRVRIESPDMRDVTEVAEFLSDNKNNSDAVISLFHLNDYDLQKHSQEIKNIFDIF